MSKYEQAIFPLTFILEIHEKIYNICLWYKWVKPASNDLGVYVNKFGKTSVVWRYTLQSIGPSGIALNY